MSEIGFVKGQKMLPKSTFVLGGASSGKSAWAESLIESSDLSLIYVATGQAFDEDTKNRIEIHRARRNARWRTIEAPLDIGPALSSIGPRDAVLIDCATMWLSNQMLAETDLDGAQDAFLKAIRVCTAPCVIVSNEVGQGIVPDNALARRFRVAQGQLNVALAAQSDLVVQVVAGLPNVLKGELP